MELKIFTIYDSKAEAYLQPFFSPTAGVAMRNFEAACNDQGHEFNKYAGDYTLFEIGEFDCDNADIRTLSTPINLGLALTFITAELPDNLGGPNNLAANLTSLHNQPTKKEA